jgi:hypothetical protein
MHHLIKKARTAALRNVCDEDQCYKRSDDFLRARPSFTTHIEAGDTSSNPAGMKGGLILLHAATQKMLQNRMYICTYVHNINVI